MRRKWKIILPIFLVLIILRILLFESIWIRRPLYSYPGYEKYQEFILFQQEVPGLDYKSESGFTDYQYNVMFQWRYRSLVDAVRDNLYDELTQIVNDYEVVSAYNVNEETMIVEIYYNKNEYRIETVHGKTFKDIVERRIKCLCELWCRVVNKRAPKEHEAEVLLLDSSLYGLGELK